MPPPPCPEGQCPQCWHHAYVLHKGNWLGLEKEADCGPCADHERNGCPTDPKPGWW
jgi:hypothetical protein